MITEPVAQAVALHYELQLGTYFESVVHLPDAVVAVGAAPGCIWNHAAVLPGAEVPNEDWVRRNLRWLERLSRPPAVYVELEMSDSAHDVLAAQCLEHVDTEAWMFYVGGEHCSPSKGRYPLQVVATPDEEAGLLRLIAECFDEAHTAAIRSEQRSDRSRRTGLRFVLGETHQPVAAATVFFASGWTVVYDVCVDPLRRGQGIGLELMARVVDATKAHAGSGMFLQCDHGPLEDFYRRCGFQTQYTRLGFARTRLRGVSRALERLGQLTRVVREKRV